VAELKWVGKGGQIASNRLIAVGRWDSAPIRRAARLAKAEGRLIDLTYGQACMWVFFIDSGQIILGTKNYIEETETRGTTD
jgi:regulator of extracellular matrix RemA (YlzA/DUF370 family)